MGDTLNLSVSKVEILEASNKSQLARVEIWIVANGNNANNYPISLGAIEGAQPTAKDKPVLAKYNKFRKDFMGHASDQIPVGFFTEDARTEVGDDGRTWLVAKAIIWKKYYPEVMEVFAKKGGKTDVSAEIEILDENGLQRGVEIQKMAIQGLTLLGVTPAVKGAKAVVLEFSEMLSRTSNILKFEQDVKLEHSSFELFDVEFAKMVKEQYPKVWKTYGNVKGEKSFAQFEKAVNGQYDSDVVEFLLEREDWGAKHVNDSTLNGLISLMKSGVVCSQGAEYHKSVILEQIKNIYPEFSEKEENMPENDELKEGCDGKMETEVEIVIEPEKVDSDDEGEKDKEPEIVEESALVVDYEAKFAEIQAELEAEKTKNAVYMEELDSLRQFKAEVEAKEAEAKMEKDNQMKLAKVEEVLSDKKVMAVFSKEEIAEFEEKAKAYDYGNIGTWANDVKVQAFSKIDLTKAQEKETKTITRFSANFEKSKPSGGGLWRFEQNQ